MRGKRSPKTLAAGIILAAIGFGMLIYAFGAVGQFKYGYYNSNITSINESALKKLYIAPKTGVKIDKTHNSIEFYGKDVTIPVVASPKGAKSMYSFGIYSLINPTIIVHENAKVTIQFVNEDDDMYHNVAIVRDAPPYPYMSMMIAPAFEDSFVWMLPESSNGKFPVASNSFIASHTGIFYYICQVMGHASEGMYGKFVVIK